MPELYFLRIGLRASGWFPTHLSSTFGLLVGDDLSHVLGDEGAALDVLHGLHAPPAPVRRSEIRRVTSQGFKKLTEAMYKKFYRARILSKLLPNCFFNNVDSESGKLLCMQTQYFIAARIANDHVLILYN